jgi:predicted neuraminidase
MMALVENPAQRDWLMEDLDNRIGSAVEEFIRWASPVMQFARFATEDSEINGHPVRAGDKVGLFYCSANRDEAALPIPARSICSAHPTRISGSATEGRTSALATGWPRPSYETCSESC